jgi:hypothetical protein
MGQWVGGGMRGMGGWVDGGMDTWGEHRFSSRMK